MSETFDAAMETFKLESARASVKSQKMAEKTNGGEPHDIDAESAQIRRQQVRKLLMLLLDPDADSKEKSGAIKLLKGAKDSRPEDDEILT